MRGNQDAGWPHGDFPYVADGVASGRLLLRPLVNPKQKWEPNKIAFGVAGGL